MAKSKTGIKLTREYRNALPEILENIGASLDSIAPQAAERMRAECPVKSGDLRDSIHSIVLRKSTKRGKDATPTLIVSVGSFKAWYGHLVEFGTVHSKPNPFIRRSFEAMKSPIRNGIKAAAQKPLRAMMQRGSALESLVE